MYVLLLSKVFHIHINIFFHEQGQNSIFVAVASWTLKHNNCSTPAKIHREEQLTLQSAHETIQNFQGPMVQDPMPNCNGLGLLDS